MCGHGLPYRLCARIDSCAAALDGQRHAGGAQEFIDRELPAVQDADRQAASLPKCPLLRRPAMQCNLHTTEMYERCLTAADACVFARRWSICVQALNH